MNKTAATAAARKRLSEGHFRIDNNNSYVYYAGEKVILYGCMGRQASHGEMVKQLAKAIQEIEAGEWETLRA